MKGLRVPAATTVRAAASIGIRRFAIVLAAAGLGVVPACGGGERLSREEFGDQLLSIDQRGSELWGRLAERARSLKPDQSLPADVRPPMREMVEFQRLAADELEELTPPEGANEEVEKLIEALRERTRTFERATDAGRFTHQDFDQITQSGEKIDAAFEQLRTEGFLPRVDEHEE